MSVPGTAADVPTSFYDSISTVPGTGPPAHNAPEGGMGEVWRANDTKLDREVAVKLLPEAVSEDAERLARFEREAKMLAALNHPNIAAIFGIEEADGRQLDLTRSPTLTAHMTAAGVVLGTAAYMSPEQARGVEVDKRADIWAFGCVLYEMLTGNQSFRGDTMSDVMASILKDEADLDALPTGTPRRLRRLLERCLNKDPHQRLHDIADARIEIEEIQAAVDGSGDTFTVGEVSELFSWVRPPGYRPPYDVTNDGQRFLINRGVNANRAEPLAVVLNWDSELAADSR